MEISVYNQTGKKEGALSVSDRIFAAKPNRDLVYQVATMLMSNMRTVLAHTKSRSEVRGGGKKPWNQKGTGRARHGSIRSPIWVGGGVAHGPNKEVNFKKKINKLQARAALASVLSARATEGRMIAVDELKIDSGKTKDAARALTDIAKGLNGWTAGDRILVVLTGTADDMPIRRATANLPYAQAVRAQDLNTLLVLSFPFLVATKGAVEVIEKTFSK